MNNFYRFRPSIGYLTHLWKSATRQDHAYLKPLISQYLPKDGIAIDIGAHGGQFSRLLCGIASNGMVIAVEPSGYSRAILRLALWLRQCCNVIIFAGALASRPSTLLIRTPLKKSGDMGYGLANLVDAGAHSIAEPVAAITLDSLVEQLALPRIDFIKADIEGFEAEMIAGAHHAIKTFRPAIFLEMHDAYLNRAGASVAALWAEMLALGFTPHEIQNGKATTPSSNFTGGDILWVPNRASDG